MNKYLMSNGDATSDVKIYVSDLIKLNLFIRNNEIPYWSGGSPQLITTYNKDEVESKIKSIITDIISNITTLMDGTGVTISLEDCTIEDSEVSVKININGDSITYDLTSTNYDITN